MKRRFDTHFFMTVLPPTFQLDSSSSSNGDAVISQLIGSSDGKETVSSDWLTPLEAVRLTLAGSNPDFDSSATVTPGILQKITLFPPQFYMLAELMKTKSYQDLLDPADCNAEGAAKVRHISPLSSFLAVDAKIDDFAHGTGQREKGYENGARDESRRRFIRRSSSCNGLTW